MYFQSVSVSNSTYSIACKTNYYELLTYKNKKKN